ncbi:hypothetical protein SELMODRAFT_413513 [Selaginella moellendorffii]|uniref:Uncharacterized protein n=1 Tax=Selaginella moellendorffii TaxID=88036 RepID=D8RQI1_SELML|nr:hypothetical protein SELMODRAFT_413513 [Selaginella moellendorffii]
MVEVVTWLKDTNDLFFMIDEYNVLDNRTSNSSLMEVWLHLETLEESSTYLHGGFARWNEAFSRAFKSTYTSTYHCKYTTFRLEEIKQYITQKDLLSEPNHDNKAIEKFLSTKDVEQQQRTLEQWVMDIAALEPIRRRKVAAALSDLIAGRDRINSNGFNPRWIIQNGDKFALVFDLVKEMVVATVGMHFGKVDRDALMMKVAEQLIEECMATHLVPSLVGLMVEMIVIHIAKQWVH